MLFSLTANKRRHRCTFMRVAALMCLLSGVAFLFSACSHISVTDLHVGQCIDMPGENETASLSTRHCSEPHTAEVIALLPIDASDLPSVFELDKQAHTACSAEFTQYVGVDPEDSLLEIAWLRPTPESWAAGDHSLTCVARCAQDSPLLTRSVAQSHM
ncbi:MULTISPECIES: septum formation family protein [unclassified Schaalia]|uniref:septum formation family protein n=1 Tax=unclassified Schaalia TaxID=2691889 RepID=UPI001E387D82|nr:MULTISPECIES: septum formation family protein [unclassified Schaalia]MCD4548957.1 septum formation family protein [Schaalia sp. lx-260]MCD4557567.1 septum formation family protein [Schaalia sp. lx-100]